VLVATTTVPGMLCPEMSQSYANVPAAANVWRNASPWSSGPESNPGEFDVTVCVDESWFVQQTVDPGFTVTDCGEKANPLIETSVSPA
jgi:hypothetical protein